MTKLMTLIAGAAIAGATSMPAFANDPFVSSQSGEGTGLTTQGGVALGAAALTGAVVVLNDDSSSSTTTSSNVFTPGAN